MHCLFSVLQWKLFIVCSSQVTDKEREFAAGAAKQLEYQQFEDDKLSQKSSSSKLSRSPLKIVKKPKSMQCKVILLDGSEYTCDVEVSVYFKTFLSLILSSGECWHKTYKIPIFSKFWKITQTQFLNTKLFPKSLTENAIAKYTYIIPPPNFTIKRKILSLKKSLILPW